MSRSKSLGSKTFIESSPRHVFSRGGVQEIFDEQATLRLHPGIASHRNGTLYVGVTSDLIRRVWEHKNGLAEGFTKRYKVHELIWYEIHETMESALHREKSIKEWKRKWKLELIEKGNLSWMDLYKDLN